MKTTRIVAIDPVGNSSLEAAVFWLSGTLLGSLAVGLCVLAVAAVGFLTLEGRLPIRIGARVILGSFILLGAPIISAGFLGLWQVEDRAATIQDSTVFSPPRERDFKPADYDPYAGASLRMD